MKDELKRREKIEAAELKKKKKQELLKEKKAKPKGKRTKKDIMKLVQNIILAFILTGFVIYGTYERLKPEDKPFNSIATFESNNVSSAEVGKQIFINASGSKSEFEEYEWSIPTESFSVIATEPKLNFTFSYPNSHRIILSIDGKIKAETTIVSYIKFIFEDAMESGDGNDVYNWAVSRNASKVVAKITYDKMNWGARNNLDVYVFNDTYHMANTTNLNITQNEIQTKIIEITNVEYGVYKIEVEYKSGEGYVRYKLDLREY